MGRKFGFKFYATVSERGQIFIPKALQDYFGITKCDRVSFVVQENGSVIFKKKGRRETMTVKRYSQKVTINDKKRDNKRRSDALNKGGSKENIHQVFNTYYKDQVRALYRAVTKES